MNALKYLALFLFVGFLIFPIFRCNGQSSGLKITHEQYHWTDDMNRLKITTPDLGLTFKITIWNQGNQSLTEQYPLWINVRVDSTTTSGVYFFKQLQIDNLYLPPNESDIRYVKVDFGGGQPIDSYEAKLTYSFGTYPSEGQPIEEYPFDFRILGNDTFQQEIQQNNGGTTYNFTLIELAGIGGAITAIALGGLYLWHRNKKNERKESKSENKPANINHLDVPAKIISKLVEDIHDKLRVTIREKPKDEREVQDAIENLLNSKEYEFDREKVSIPYSSKYYVPDFTFDALDTALDAKLCNSPSDEKKIIDEINADIPAYKSKYSYVVFVVYDMGFIRDNRVFVKGIEKNNSNVRVTVVKH